MRRFFITTAVCAAVLPAGLAVASAPPGSTPPDASATIPADTMATTDTMAATEGSMAPEDSSMAPTAELATVYDDSGEPVATITATGSEMGATDYEDGNDPDDGHEYVRVTVQVESQVSDGTFSIGVGDFVLQDNHGAVTTAETVKTAAQAASGDEISDSADLASGESIEMVLTFQVESAAGPQSVFYRPDDSHLVDVTEFA